jgi:hypothetical protein
MIAPRQYAATPSHARRLALLILSSEAMQQAVAARAAGLRVTEVHIHTGRAVVRTAPATTTRRPA